MAAQYEITKQFTSEFSIRAFIEHRYEPTMTRLRTWATDPNEHVRRLVSEGTRPRLPWAARLPRFQHDPQPVLELLETLRDDPSDYVRRSVANNLNDIAKDHPAVVVEVCGRWWADGDANRRRLVRHALRSLIKAGDPAALAVLGYRPDVNLGLDTVAVEPAVVQIGEKVSISCTVVNAGAQECPLLVDLVVDFVRANGKRSHKVFKVGSSSIAPGQNAQFRKSISLAQHSTRRHYPGTHHVRILINGVEHAAGDFDLQGPLA